MLSLFAFNKPKSIFIKTIYMTLLNHVFKKDKNVIHRSPDPAVSLKNDKRMN